MATFTPETSSLIFEHIARNIIQDFSDRVKKPGDLKPLPAPPQKLTDNVVGILGAGVGGLYTALILESLGIKFKINEASNRVGGRLFTYKFEEGGKYDYYVSLVSISDYQNHELTLF